MRTSLPIRNFLRQHSTGILLTVILVSNGISMVMTVANGVTTKRVAIDTHTAVDGEKQILAAVRKAEMDNGITATQKTNIIICMLQVPQPQRVPKESDCRKQALTSSDTSHNTSQGISNVAPKASVSSSSPNNAPSGQPAQSNTQQQDNNPPAKKPFQIQGVESCVPPLGICVEH